jgi:iron-regulated transporter 1
MSAGGDRTAEFAFYLLLIVCFQTTLFPSAFFGFSTTRTRLLYLIRKHRSSVHLAVTAITLSTWTGKQVDQQPKLFLVRCCILSQKLSSFGAYISFFFLLKHYPTPASLCDIPSLLLFLGIVVSGCVLRVSTVCIQISIEKDWVISISQGIEGRLTTLNISLRRVDLLCNLLSPLFITYVLLSLSYRTSVGVLAGFTAISCIFELYWIGTVYEKFPQLKRDDDLKTQEHHLEQETITPSYPSSWGNALRLQVRDWSEFTSMPVFLSSISVSLLYITVLSCVFFPIPPLSITLIPFCRFDGNMLGYLKTQMFDDTLLATMRSICVLTGLFGTVVAPWLEARLGSVRAGSWCIWCVYYKVPCKFLTKSSGPKWFVSCL